MKVYRYKLYTNAKRGELRELIYRFCIVTDLAKCADELRA